MTVKEEYILVCAERVFAEKGFAGASTREIARQAGANISMISYYFGSKEKLYERIFEERMTASLSFAQGILEAESLNAWEKLLAIVERYAERISRHREFYIVFQREQLFDSNERISKIISDSKKNFLRLYVSIVEEGVQKGIFTNVVQPELLHATVSGILFAGMNGLPLYKAHFEGGNDYEIKYYSELLAHLKIILKYILGYEAE